MSTLSELRILLILVIVVCSQITPAQDASRLIGKTYSVTVELLTENHPVTTEASLELMRDGQTTVAKLTLPANEDFQAVRLHRANFPSDEPLLFGSFNDLIIKREQFGIKALTENHQPLTIPLMGKPNAIGSLEPNSKRTVTFTVHDVAGKTGKNISVVAFENISKTTSPLVLSPHGEIILPESFLYQDKHNAMVSLKFTITDMNSGTGFQPDSILIGHGTIQGYPEKPDISIPFLNDWSAPPPDVNVYQGVLKGQGETPLPNQTFEVFDEVTDSHIMHRALSRSLITNAKGEFQFALKNRHGKTIPNNKHCAILLDHKYYVIDAGTGLVVEKSAPGIPGQGQRFTPAHSSPVTTETAVRPAAP